MPNANFSIDVSLDLEKLKKGIKEGKEINDEFAQSVLKVDKGLKATDETAKKTGKSLSQFDDVIKGLTLIGLATALFEVTKELFAFNQELQKSQRMAENLGFGELTTDIQATADTFNTEFNEVLISANALSKQFGIDGQKSLELINKGFLNGANVSGEFLDQLKEYPAQMKAVGLDAEQTISIITQQVKDGVFSDKGIDTIKEAGLRLRELTPATRDALDGIGLSSKEIEQSLKDGSKSIFEVIQSVSNKLDELPPQSATVGTAIADIFGGAGEDAGLDYIKTLGKIQDGLSDVDSAQSRLLDVNTELGNKLGELFGLGDEGFGQWTTDLEVLGKEGILTLINGIQELLGYFTDLYDDSESFRVSVKALQSVFESLFQVVDLGFDQLITGFTTFGDLFEAVMTGNFSQIDDILAESFTSVQGNFIEFGNDVANSFLEGFETATTTQVSKVLGDVALETTNSPIPISVAPTLVKPDEPFDYNSLLGEEGFELDLLGGEETIPNNLADLEEFYENAFLLAELSGQNQTQLQQIYLDEKRRLLQEELDAIQGNSEKEIALRQKTQKEILKLDVAKSKLDARTAKTKSSQKEYEMQQALQVANQGIALATEVFGKNKAVAFAQVGITTAMGIMSALASIPPNIPLSVLIGATGAVQLAKIAGFQSGGFTGFGVDNESAGVVHRNEFVIPAPSVREVLSGGGVSLVRSGSNDGNLAEAVYALAEAVEQKETQVLIESTSEIEAKDFVQIYKTGIIDETAIEVS